MKTAVISVKVDEQTKRRAQATAKVFGFPLSTLINAYLMELANTGQIHFSSVEPMTQQMEMIVEQAEQEIKTGKSAGPFDTADEAIVYLDSL